MHRDIRPREGNDQQPTAAHDAAAEAPAHASFSATGEKPAVAQDTAQHPKQSASDQAFGNEPEKERAEIKHDALFEHLAHRFAYKSELSAEDHAYLEVHGLRLGQQIAGKGGLQMTTFIPIAGGTEAPVLAFRGTSELKDYVDDASPSGVGSFQMAGNEGLIAQTLASLGGAATVCGHSLGGALAQMTASRFPDLVGRVVTFQSPGIPKPMVDKLEKHNEDEKQKGGHEVSSHHYEVQGDLIPLAGEAFTSGFKTIIERGKDPATEIPLAPVFGEHQALPLDELQQSEGKAEPEGMHKLDGRSPAHAYDVPVDYRKNDKAHKFVDALRVGAGRVIEALQAAGHANGHATQEAYVGVWQQVRVAIDSGADPKTVLHIISSSKVRDEDKQLMITNYGEIEAVR